MSVGDNMSKIMILGAGGHGKVVAEIAKLMNKWDEIVFLDDNKSLHEVNSYKVIGTLSDYLIYKDRYQYAFVAIGDNKLRLKLIKNMMKNGISIPILRHPLHLSVIIVKLDRNCNYGGFDYKHKFYYR